MTNFEISMLLVFIAYCVICARLLFIRTRRNKSGIEATNRILDCHNMRTDMKVTAEMDLRVSTDEAKEYAQAWNEFIEKLEQIQNKYEEVNNDKSN